VTPATRDRDLARLAKALLTTNDALAKLAATFRAFAILPEDDPLWRGLVDAETAVRISSALADKVARQEGEAT
jgi:hypothetical protein